ncbi:MAG: hypothetical protein ACRC57_07290 [Sarcina sp.]
MEKFNLKKHIIEVQENRCNQEKLDLLLKYCGALITNFYIKLPVSDSLDEGKSILFEIFMEINIHSIDEKGINEYIKK